MSTVHRYDCRLQWRGSTAEGIARYDRNHTVGTPPVQRDLELSADPAFRGDPARHNPEQLLLAAASSCQLLSFLALAAKAGVDVVSYSDNAEALMPADGQPVRITRIVLRPSIVVRGNDNEPRLVHRLVEQAHSTCFIANSLSSEIVLEPAVEYVPSADDVQATADVGTRPS